MRVIGEPLTAEESAAFIAAARRCVKARVKFRHMGRDPKTGVDCAGLLQWCAKEIGRSVFDLAAYGREPHKNGLHGAIVTNLGDPVPIDSMRPGDIPLMRFEGEPRHVGLIGDYPGGLSLIHCYSTVKHVVEHRLDDQWRRNIVALWRL